MKRIIAMCIALCTVMTGFAQVDSTGTQPEGDTIRVGGMVIIRSGKGADGKNGKHGISYRTRKVYKPSNVSTNWGIIDLGIANYVDNTNYGSAEAQAYAPGSNENYFDLKNGKSINVNIWIVTQKVNLIKHYVNLKYGVGLELNNYRYKAPIRYDDKPDANLTNPPIVTLDPEVALGNRHYSKNKLAADYLTVPLMLNFNFTPNRQRAFGLSAGVSAGFLYSARNKTITSDEGKRKAKDDFDLERWKLSYVGELSLGFLKLYGSYAFKSMYKRGLDITPYTVGFRISNW
jgi:hypothetical protein